MVIANETATYAVRDDDDDDPELLTHPGGEVVDTWSENYPYHERVRREDYEEQKRLLQIELLKLQQWSQAHLNPRGARVVALEKPTDRERTQWYFQRYIKHFPAAGEMVLFDRSWYNRAGVEQMLVNDGISLTKLWFSVTQTEQRTRFTIRQVDPVRQ